jgi:D-serine deaminase-like pyridoxal phosphate-dependent protein
MKLTSVIAVTTFLASAALPGYAANAQEQQLSLCKAQLAAIYGEDAGFRLKSIRSGKTPKMRIQARPAEGDSVMVTCWLGDSGTVNLADRDGVALVNPAYDSSNKLTVIE